MKYTITESKFNEIIDKFISFEFGELKHIRDERNRDVFFNSNGEPVIIILHTTEVYIKDDIYRRINHFFSIKTVKNIQDVLRYWFIKHMDLEPELVFSFDDDEFIY